MGKPELIELLNKALQAEYTDTFLYTREADRVKEKEIAGIFEKFGRMELRHTDNLAMQIQALGSTPKWDIKGIEVKETVPEMLQDHLDKENKAIESYSKLIELADKENEDQLKLVLKGIKSEEETHHSEIKKLLEK